MRAGNIFPLLKSRVALNIYFWLGVLLFQVDNINNGQRYQFGYYLLFIVVNLLILIALLYTNNLWLVPKLLARRKRKIYVAISVPFTFLMAVLYTAVQKLAVLHFPGIDIYQISLITNPVSPNWSSEIWLEEVLVFFFAFLLLVFIFTALWFWHDNAKQKKRAEQLARKQTETELAFLRNQLNPHFLFNTLNNLYGLSIAKSDATPEVILKLSGLLRYMLYQSNAELISFEKEKEAMQAYVDLELLRMKDTSGFNFTITADRPCLIPPLLWLPVLENIFKHGTRITGEKLFIDFRFVIENNCLRIYSRNRFKAENSATDGGIGLENLEKRLELLYPGRYTMEINHDGEFYSISTEVRLA